MTDAPASATTSRLATLGGFGAILLWSTTVALARSLSVQLGPVTAAAAVYTVSGAFALFPLLRRGEKRQRIRRLSLSYLLGCGALFVIYMVVLYLAVGRAADGQQVLEVGLLNYLWPALTIVFSLVLLNKKASWVLLPGTLLALIGIFLVLTQGATVSWASFAGNWSGNPVAYSMALAAAVSWALYSALTRRWAGGQDEGAVILFLPVTALVLLLLACFFDEPRVLSWRCAVETVFLGLATYFAYVLWDAAMRRGNVVLVAAGSYLTPLLSTIVSCLYLEVVPGPKLWLGCGVLILGSVLSWRSISHAAA